MNINGKSTVVLTVLALGAVCSAQRIGTTPGHVVQGPSQSQPITNLPQPQLVPPGAIHRADPIYIQRVMRVGRNVINVGPKIPYQPPLFHANRVGSEIFDAFEGNSTNNANPDVPTDGLYGETFIPTAPGNRWFFGDAWVNTFLARHFLQEFPGQVGKGATGVDFLLYNDAAPNTGNVTEVLFFTSSDPFTIATPVAPTNINAGVKLTYSAITPGSGIYSNVDLSAAPLAMPTTTSGWFLMEIASGDDGSGNPIEAHAAQPLMWGTKALNPSQTDTYEYMDGTGAAGTQTGTYAQSLFNWTFSLFSTPTSYVVSRGFEHSASNLNPSNLSGTPGQDVIIQTRPQPVSTFNNAECTATVTLDPSTPAPASLRLLRAIVVAKANALPLGTSIMTISIKNNSTGAFDTVKTGPAVNSGADGTLMICASIPVANIPNYINTANSTVQVKVGVRQPKPAISGWNLTINQIQIAAATVGPDPLCPSFAFSTTQ